MLCEIWMSLVFHKSATIKEMPVLHVYETANWFSPEGASRKLSQFERRGIPSLRNWRFITLTVDPKQFTCSRSAYEYIKPRLRFFIRKLVRYLRLHNPRYAWKLEFQANGFPHWHIAINHLSKICPCRLNNLWGFGRTNVKRIETESLRYLFKYMSKELHSGVPDWFLQLARPRVFQTSNFFPKVASKNQSPSVGNKSRGTKELEDEQEGKDFVADSQNGNMEGGACARAPTSLGERLERNRRILQISKNGKYVGKVILNQCWDKCLAIWNSRSPRGLVEYKDSKCFYVPYDLMASEIISN